MLTRDSPSQETTDQLERVFSSGAPRLSDTAPAPTIPMSLESSYVQSALFTFLVGVDIPGRRLS